MTKLQSTDDGAKMSWLTRLASRSAETLSSALSRFSFAVLAVGALALLVNLDIADARLFEERHELRIATALGAGAAISIVVTLLLERMKAGALARLAASAMAGIAAMLLVWFGWDGFLFMPPFLAAAILVIPLAPHVTGSTGFRFWTFLLWASFGAALGFLSVMLFVLGVSAILEMVRYLFGIGFGGDAYEHIYATAALFVGPVFALGRIPRDFDEEAAIDHSDRFISGIVVLQNWVALPLVLAAAAILHLYAAKILVTGEVPKNQIGWIVGFYALFVLTLRVAAAPFIATGGAAQRLFGRVWVPILIAPLALLAYAVWLRIAAEGFTAERYYLALAALSAALVVLAQSLRPIRGDIRVMVAIPIVLLAASSFGPWGVEAMVARSQTGLIARDFATGPDNRLHPESLGEDRRNVLRSRISALAEVDALPRLNPLMTDEGRARLERELEVDSEETVYLHALGIDYGEISPIYVTFVANKPTPFDIAGFDTVQTGLEASESASALEPFSQNPAAAVQDSQIVVRLRGVVDRIDPAPIVGRVGSGNGRGGDETEPVVVDIRTAGGRSLRLRIRYFSRLESATFPISVNFDAAFRSAEWPMPPSLGGNR